MRYYAILILLITGAARADFLVEPYAGYATSQSEGDNKTSGLREKSTDGGVAVGARLAFVLPGGIWLGPDYFYVLSSPVKYSDPPNTSDATGTRSILFLDIGFDPPNVPARFLAGFGLTNQFTITQTSGESLLSGNAFKLGAGFKMFSKVAINVEYIQHMFSKAKASNGNEVDIEDAYDNFKAATVLISLSVPFIF